MDNTIQHGSEYVRMARLSADDTTIQSSAIRYSKRLVLRFISFAFLSLVVVYIAAGHEIRDTELFLGFVIVFTTMLTIGTMILELIAWLYSRIVNLGE